MADKILFTLYFRMAGQKEENPQPSTSGTAKEK